MDFGGVEMHLHNDIALSRVASQRASIPKGRFDSISIFSEESAGKTPCHEVIA